MLGSSRAESAAESGLASRIRAEKISEQGADPEQKLRSCRLFEEHSIRQMTNIDIGAIVSTLATNFDTQGGKKWSKDHFGDNWKTARVRGEVIGWVKKSRKWLVRWDIDQTKSSHDESSLVLEVIQTILKLAFAYSVSFLQVPPESEMGLEPCWVCGPASGLLKSHHRCTECGKQIHVFCGHVESNDSDNDESTTSCRLCHKCRPTRVSWTCTCKVCNPCRPQADQLARSIDSLVDATIKSHQAAVTESEDVFMITSKDPTSISNPVHRAKIVQLATIGHQIDVVRIILSRLKTV